MITAKQDELLEQVEARRGAKAHSSLGNRTPEEFARSVSMKRLEKAVF